MRPAASSAGCTITVCRDCCCGTSSKHPEVDHDALFDALARQTSGRAQVRVSTCLLACDRSNVVVVAPGRLGRGVGGRPVWFQQVLDIDTVASISRWVRSGGPGLADVPAELDVFCNQLMPEI